MSVHSHVPQMAVAGPTELEVQVSSMGARRPSLLIPGWNQDAGPSLLNAHLYQNKCR